MGRVIAPHGIKGWVKLKVFTDSPDSLLDFPRWWIRAKAGWQEREVAEAELRSVGLVARFLDDEDRNAAEDLKGLDIGVPRDTLPVPDEGEYYWADLIGLAVLTAADELLGAVEGLIETGANDVLVVRAQDSGVERLIPYIEPVIISVDLTGKRIVVDWQPDY